MVVAIAVLFCWTVSVGDFPVPIGDVVRTLLGGGTEDSRFIVRELRLPRALVGLMVGAAFGLSGAILQSLARNPLASPDIIGVTQGAALAAVGVIVLGGSGDLLGRRRRHRRAAGGARSAAWSQPRWCTLLSYRRGIVGYRLVLIGIGVGATMTAGLQYLLTRATIYEATQATVWLTGSLNGRGWEHVRPVFAGLIVLVPISLALGRQLRLLQMGDDAAKGLGARVERSRIALIVCAVGLAALATASAGPVAFVAFIAPVLAPSCGGQRTPGARPVDADGRAAGAGQRPDRSTCACADRAPRGHRHRDHRCAVPAVVAVASQQHRQRWVKDHLRLNVRIT